MPPPPRAAEAEEVCDERNDQGGQCPSQHRSA
jgi:hypothetical protein